MSLKKVKHFDEFELKDRLSGELLELLVDTKEGIIYHVHPRKGHAKSAAELLGLKEKEINKFNASHLVSAVIKFENKKIEEVMIGRSGLELGYNIEHTRKQLEKAKAIVEKAMRLSEQLGEVTIAKDVKEMVA